MESSSNCPGLVSTCRTQNLRMFCMPMTKLMRTPAFVVKRRRSSSEGTSTSVRIGEEMVTIVKIDSTIEEVTIKVTIIKATIVKVFEEEITDLVRMSTFQWLHLRK